MHSRLPGDWKTPLITMRFIIAMFLLIFVWVHSASAQSRSVTSAVPQALSNDAIQEMQKTDPQAAQAVTNAIQKGDFQTAKKIYEDFKAGQQKEPESLDLRTLDQKTAEELNRAIQKGDVDAAQKIVLEFQKKKQKKSKSVNGEEAYEPSMLERTLSKDLPPDVSTHLEQFGYDIFTKAASPISAATSVPVGSDYLLGPGDQFTLTLWGTTEGIYTFKVTKEGDITLPKVGVVPVAGIKFGVLEDTLRRHLSKYYSNFNLSVAMGTLKTITVYVVGEVASPGSYTVNSLTTVFGALHAAGGPSKQGTLRKVQVLRSGKVIKNLDLYDFLLGGDRSHDIKLQTDDTVFVPLIGPVVGVAGAVYRPAVYELGDKETIGDVIKVAGGIMPLAVSNRLQIYRFLDHQKKIVMDIKMPLSTTDSKRDADGLQGRAANMDTIVILPIYDKIWESVNLSGSVRNPGDFQWKPDLKLKEVIQEGQLLPTADLHRAEVIRLNSDFMDRTIIPVDLTALLAGDESQNVILQPKDHIRVYTTFRAVEKIKVMGEVVRPGEYETFKGERLSSLLRRVGGFTPEAYTYGLVFKRKNIKSTQTKNLQSFITRLQTQIIQNAAGNAATAVNPEDAALSKAEYALNEGLLNNLKAMQDQLEGRVAISISENIDKWAGSKDDLLLQDADIIDIPKRPQEVSVLGEVYTPGAQVFIEDMTVKDYIDRTGSYTRYADKNYVYIVKANGFAFGADSSGIGNIENIKLNAGDTIFVPQKVERYATMRLFKDIIDILFKTAVTAATVHILFP